jgi:magnesium chelatase subunit I
VSIKLDSHLLISASPAARIEFLQTIAQICVKFNVDGHRADIMIKRTARTNAAFEGVHVLTVDMDNHGSKLARRYRKRPKEDIFIPRA